MAEWSLFNTLKNLGPKLGGPLLLPFTSRKLAEDPRAKPYLPPESNRSLLNPLIPAITGIKNFIGIPGTPQTSQQEEWMKNKIFQKTRESGSLNGVVNYKDYGSTQADQPSGDWTGGVMGAPFAFGNTLGKSGYSIPQQGGNINWDKSGTSYDFEKGSLGKGIMQDFITNTVNTGGLLNQDYGNNFPLHIPSPLNYNPDIQITAKDIFDLFGGGKLMHKGETEIKGPLPTQPTQPTQPTAPAAPTWTPPPTPTQRNVTKFSPTRSTAIKGGRGGRGNVGGNRMKAGTSKNYGVTGRRVTGGR